MAISRTQILYVTAAAAFLAPLTQTIYAPSMVTIREEFATSNALAGATISIYGFVLIFGQFIYGPLLDRIAARRVLLLALGGYVVASVLTFFSASIYQLILMRGFQALTIASAQIVGPALVADLYPPQERGRAVGRLQLVVHLGPVCGPLLGAAIAVAAGWRFDFLFLALAGLVVLALNGRVLPTLPLKTEPLTLAKARAMLTTPSPLGACLLVLAQFFTLHSFLGFLPVLFQERGGLGEGWIGLSLLPVTLAMALGAPWGGRLTDRLGRRTPMVAGMGAAAVAGWGMAGLAFSGHPQVMVLGALPVLAGLGLAFSLNMAAGVSLLLDWFPEVRASAVGMYNAARFVGGTLGPITVGYLVDSFGLPYGFLAPAAVLTLAAAVGYAVVREPRPALRALAEER